MALQSINPATDQLVAEYPEATPEEVTRILRAARAACGSWRRTALPERAASLRRAGALLRARKDELARLMAVEMGKPLAQGRAESEKCAWVCDYYAEEGAGHLTPETIATDASRSYAAFEPLGVVLAVMPWNFPLWQVFRFAAPALMAGNTAVLKHASNVPQCALAVEEVFRAAGFPEGTFRTLLVAGSAVASIIADSRVAAVTLTGSEAAGREVAARAGAACKKTVLELGGSDPFIVLEDADLAAAAATAVRARYQNTGQSCIAAKRFVVVER